MPTGPPTEEQIREELKKQGITDLDDLVQKSVETVSEASDDAELEWYVYSGSKYNFIHS